MMLAIVALYERLEDLISIVYTCIDVRIKKVILVAPTSMHRSQHGGDKAINTITLFDEWNKGGYPALVV